jgi:hypothetical protein
MAYGNLKVDSLIYDNSGSDVTVSVSALAGAGSAAGINSPTFTGIPAAPTASSGTNTTQIATTAFVTTGLATKLPLAGGTLTGGLTGTTATFATSTLVGSNPLSGAGTGILTRSSGSISISNVNTIDASQPSGAIQIYENGDSSANITLFNKGSATFGGAVTADSYKTPAQAVSALAIDLATGNYFTKTIAGNSTFTFTNPPASGTVGSFTLELTHSSGTVAWPASVKWPADTAPTLTAGKTHLFIFVTDDGGTRYRGAALADYVN